jgi:predicted component of type VI protein secretion system
LAPDALSRFGKRASRLGIDLVVGDGMEDEATVEITLGPVSLSTYLNHQKEEGMHRLHQVLHLLLPCHVVYAVRWLVGDTDRAPRLGVGKENSLLGINTHLGRS